MGCCKDCNKRSIVCHAACEEYIAEVEMMAVIREDVNKARQLSRQLREFKQDSYHRHERRHR